MCQSPLSIEAEGGLAGGAPWKQDPETGNWTWTSNHVPHTYEIVPKAQGFVVVFKDSSSEQAAPSYVLRGLLGGTYKTVSTGPTVFKTVKKAVGGTWQHHNLVGHLPVFLGIRLLPPALALALTASRKKDEF